MTQAHQQGLEAGVCGREESGGEQGWGGELQLDAPPTLQMELAEHVNANQRTATLEPKLGHHRRCGGLRERGCCARLYQRQMAYLCPMATWLCVRTAPLELGCGLRGGAVWF